MDDHRDHLRALLEAYTEASGIALTLSFERRKTLREFDRRGLTPADVRGVIAGIKRAVKMGMKGYTDASLDWRNAMKDVDTFEERAQKFRQAEARRAGRAREAAAKAPVATTHQLPGGETITRLEPGTASAEVPRIDMKRELHKFAEQLGRREPK